MVNATDKVEKTLLDRILPFFLIIGSAAAAIYLPSEIGVLSAFIITLIVYILRRYNFRLLIGMGIILLILSAALFAWMGEANANRTAIPAFYFLATGTIGMLIDSIRKK